MHGIGSRGRQVQACKAAAGGTHDTPSYPNPLYLQLDIPLNFLTGVRRFNKETGMVRSQLDPVVLTHG